MSDNEKIEGLKWPSCEFCGKELELIRPHVFDECYCEGAVSARQAEPCRCIDPQIDIEGKYCIGCGRPLYANDSDGWISLEDKSASEIKELFKGTELQLDSSIDTRIANEKLSHMTEDKKEPSAKTPEEFFNPDQAEREAYDLTAQFCYSGYLDNSIPSDKLVVFVAKILRELSDLKLRLSGEMLTDEEIVYEATKEYGTVDTHPHLMDQKVAWRTGAKWARLRIRRAESEQVEKLKQENEQLKQQTLFADEIQKQLTVRIDQEIAKFATLQASHKELLGALDKYQYQIDYTTRDWPVPLDIQAALANASKLTK